MTANSKKFIRCGSTPQTLVTGAVNSAQIHRLMKEQDVKGSLQTGSALKEVRHQQQERTAFLASFFRSKEFGRKMRSLAITEYPGKTAHRGPGMSFASVGVMQEACFVFTELVDYLITDVATEAHRAARLGFDYRLNIEEEEDARLLAQARTAPGESTCSGAEINCKYTVDVFGQSHPVLASEVFDCMNCGRSIVAGRFAPHLEKCMGKVCPHSPLHRCSCTVTSAAGHAASCPCPPCQSLRLFAFTTKACNVAQLIHYI